MRYAHSVARGYDDRAATTAALMCLLRRRHTRSQKSNAPKASERNVERADTPAPTRVLPDWRQNMEETRPKHYSSLAPQASLSGREGSSSSVPCCARGWPWARADTGRSPWHSASGGSVPPCSVLSPPCAAFEPLFLAVRAAYRFRCASQCVQSTHNLKAQPGFELLRKE